MKQDEEKVDLEAQEPEAELQQLMTRCREAQKELKQILKQLERV